MILKKVGGSGEENNKFFLFVKIHERNIDRFIL